MACNSNVCGCNSNASHHNSIVSRRNGNASHHNSTVNRCDRVAGHHNSIVMQPLTATQPQSAWQPGFFEQTFGCLQDEPIDRPTQGEFEQGYSK